MANKGAYRDAAKNNPYTRPWRCFVSIHLKVAAMVVGVSACAASLALADDRDHEPSRHVLLISIDGMHALDFQNCVASNTCPNLKALRATGVNYTRTSTSKPSDSFPGLMAIVTGGTPKLVGAYYDVAYDRVLAPPAADTGNGVLHGSCTVGQPNGTRTEYEELRSDAHQFAVHPGHEYPDVESVVARLKGYDIVRKNRGVPEQIAEQTDPRDS